MMAVEYRITSHPAKDTPFSMRVAMNMMWLSARPFHRDDRISMLMTVLSAELLPLIETTTSRPCWISSGFR